jgi:hypothetical protein
MDRTIVYPGSIPLDSDLLSTNRNTMIALGALMSAVFGTEPIVDGLAVLATAPPALTVLVAPGCITSFEGADNTPYGTLPADTFAPIVKMGISHSATAFNVTPPPTAGQSIIWLVEASFQEADDGAMVLPYYNAAAPTQTWLGPSNSGTPQPTARSQRAVVRIRAGATAATGSQVAPSVAAGWIGLALINTYSGQTSVGAGDIAAFPATPIIPFKLPYLRPGFSALQQFSGSGNFVVPHGVTLVKVRAYGAGGGGGGNTAQGGGGGGGGGGFAEGILQVNPGQIIPVTVGAGGAGGSNSSGSAVGNNGHDGGTSSFGGALGATGGHGGAGSLNGGQGDSGGGGSGFGAAVTMTGGSGNAGFSTGPNGFGGHGASGAAGGGGGAASSGLPSNGAGPGGGGGGGGGNISGASGANGLVVVEY